MRRLIIGAFAVTVAVAGCAPTPEAVQPLTGTTAASATTAEPPAATAADPPATTPAEIPATTPAPQLESPEPPAPASPPADSGDAAVSGPASDASGEVAGEPTETDRASELAERVTAALDGRSFREFDPGRDADKRKAVILDFFDGMRLWAQYAEGEHALVEWEIRSELYRVEEQSDGSEVTLYFVDPQGSQILPTDCATCVVVNRVSISVMNVFDPERIAFKVNDPYGTLQSPFPVFTSWTRFEEDELVN